MKTISIVALTEAGCSTADRIWKTLPTAELFVLQGRAKNGIEFDDTSRLLRDLFAQGRPIIGVCAAGILIRLLAPVLNAKRDEPPVLAVSEDGDFVVPLLGGHRGGNRLARKLAKLLEGRAAITTASDRRYGVALDDPPPGLILANPHDTNTFLAQLINGESIKLHGETDWLTDSELPLSTTGELTIEITDKKTEGSPRHLVYHRQNLAIGIGCERDTTAEEIETLLTQALEANDLPQAAIAGIWSIDMKMDEPGIADTAATFSVPLRFFDSATLETQTPRLKNPSKLVFREVGAHGVSEAAALAAAGEDGELIVQKLKSTRATCAIARSTNVLKQLPGMAQGHLSLVGLGPGQKGWRSSEATQILHDAEDIIGFKRYFDLIEDMQLRAKFHCFEIGAETDRVRKALNLAASGRCVALICSGDAGIYAMASLVFEFIEKAPHPNWHRVSITIAPGISALQAAAARSGAPLGHDFCAISLSDLLTPWHIIESRIKAAAEGNFVVAFYNPVSKRRNRQLPAARDILLTCRPKDTPVVLAQNLGRPDEVVSIISLEELSIDNVDMATLVLVGSSETRRINRGSTGFWVYTPRGYTAKNGERTDR